MGFVSVRDALGLLALYAAEDSPKYGSAPTRWVGRLALESDDLSLEDAQLAAAALAARPRRHTRHRGSPFTARTAPSARSAAEP